jgi:hypothetical protein
MSNKSLFGKNTKTKTNKNYFNLISKKTYIAFEISNVKMDKNCREQATLKVKVTSFSFNTNRKLDFMACLDAHLYEIEYTFVMVFLITENGHTALLLV